MTSITYDSIYSYFLGFIEDYKLASLSEEDMLSIIEEYLSKALGRHYLRKMFKEFTNDSSTKTIDFEMNNGTADAEFITRIIAKAMAIEWLEPRVNTDVLLRQMVAGKNQNFYSQSNHLTSLENRLENAKKELRLEISEYEWLEGAGK